MRYIFTFIFFSLLFFTACKSDSSTSTDQVEDSTEMNGTNSESTLDLESIDVDETTDVEIEVEMDKAIKDEDLAKKIIVESKKKEVDAIAKVEDKNETALVGKTEEQKKKEAAMKLEATKKMIDNSVNKGKTCEQILEEQEGFIKEFSKSKDRKVILKMAKAKNDPFFAQCMEAEEFAAKMDDLTTKLEEIMDQE